MHTISCLKKSDSIYLPERPLSVLLIKQLKNKSAKSLEWRKPARKIFLSKILCFPKRLSGLILSRKGFAKY